MEELAKGTGKALAASARATLANIEDAAGRDVSGAGGDELVGAGRGHVDAAVVPGGGGPGGRVGAAVQRGHEQGAGGFERQPGTCAGQAGGVHQGSGAVGRAGQDAGAGDWKSTRPWREAAEAASGDLRTKALTAKKEESYKLYDASTVKGKEASRGGGGSAEGPLQLDIANSNYSIVSQQVDLWTKAVGTIDGQLAAAGERKATQAAAADKAKTDRDKAVADLQNAVTKVVGDFDRDVTKKFQEADGRMVKAIDQADKALALASGGGRRAMEVGQVAMRQPAESAGAWRRVANLTFTSAEHDRAGGGAEPRGGDAHAAAGRVLSADGGRMRSVGWGIS